jgi:hypothetical protein
MENKEFFNKVKEYEASGKLIFVPGNTANGSYIKMPIGKLSVALHYDIVLFSEILKNKVENKDILTQRQIETLYGVSLFSINKMVEEGKYERIECQRGKYTYKFYVKKDW